MREGPVLFVHGSPRDPDEYILDAAGAGENLALLQADHPGVKVCFFGHTHVKTLTPSPDGLADEGEPGEVLNLPGNGPYLVNPGSVGQPRDGDSFASYVLAEVASDGEPGARVAYRAVPYDVEKAQAKIRAAGLPGVLADRLARGR
jgi:diadenosine tetraphosphatase ApaH/serine/threonine PP2A family protein phosphatase